MARRGWGGRIFSMQRGLWRAEAERRQRRAEAEEELRQELGRDPTFVEVAARLYPIQQER